MAVVFCCSSGVCDLKPLQCAVDFKGVAANHWCLCAGFKCGVHMSGSIFSAGVISLLCLYKVGLGAVGVAYKLLPRSARHHNTLDAAAHTAACHACMAFAASQVCLGCHLERFVLRRWSQ